MGPLMLDLNGQELCAEEKEILDHPLVGGVIFFSRNYHDPRQMAELVGQVRHYGRNDMLLAVDHEGGRVQRFRQEFSAIPAMGSLYPKCAGDVERAGQFAEQLGWLMAAEVLALDIDLSFAPVLDIQGISSVIGDRAFHPQSELIIALAARFIHGMHHAGMKATGKHFPGHGNVQEDSHVAMPVDTRSEEAIRYQDMRVFAEIHAQGLLDAVMPAHVRYPAVDSQPACFSRRWLRDILRKELDFDGVVFSDDLSMQGASLIGHHGERALAALDAGCDMVLVCNDRAGAIRVIDSLPANFQPSDRLKTMRKSACPDWQTLHASKAWSDARRCLEQFDVL